jgi:hypothetical protein
VLLVALGVAVAMPNYRRRSTCEAAASFNRTASEDVQVNGDIALDPRQTERMEAMPWSADTLPSQRKAKTAMPADTVRTALPDRTHRDMPDVQTQLETLFDQVWRCEAEWRFDDLLDLATRLGR